MSVSLLNPHMWFMWAPGSGISFSHAVAQCRLTFADSAGCVAIAFRTIIVIDSAAELVGTETHTGFDNRGTLSYWDNAFTQCSRLLRDSRAGEKICEWILWVRVLYASKNRGASVVFIQHKSFDNVTLESIGTLLFLHSEVGVTAAVVCSLTYWADSLLTVNQWYPDIFRLNSIESEPSSWYQKTWTKP